MKKNIVLIALLTMVYAVNGAEQKSKEEIFEQFVQLSLSAEKKAWCQKVAHLETIELKKMEEFFKLVLKDHDENGFLIDFYVKAGFGNIQWDLLDFPRAWQQLSEVKELIEQEKTTMLESYKTVNDALVKEVKDKLVIEYAQGCLACIGKELDERQKGNDEFPKDFTHFMTSLRYFRK